MNFFSFLSIPFPVFRLQTRDRLGGIDLLVGKDRQPTEDIMGNLAGKKEKMGVVSNPITRGK